MRYWWKKIFSSLPAKLIGVSRSIGQPPRSNLWQLQKIEHWRHSLISNGLYGAYQSTSTFLLNMHRNNEASHAYFLACTSCGSTRQLNVYILSTWTRCRTENKGISWPRSEMLGALTQRKVQRSRKSEKLAYVRGNHSVTGDEIGSERPISDFARNFAWFIWIFYS